VQSRRGRPGATTAFEPMRHAWPETAQSGRPLSQIRSISCFTFDGYAIPTEIVDSVPLEKIIDLRPALAGRLCDAIDVAAMCLEPRVQVRTPAFVHVAIERRHQSFLFVHDEKKPVTLQPRAGVALPRRFGGFQNAKTPTSFGAGVTSTSTACTAGSGWQLLSYSTDGYCEVARILTVPGFRCQASLVSSAPRRVARRHASACLYREKPQASGRCGKHRRISVSISSASNN